MFSLGKAVYTMQLKPEVQPVVHAARKVTVALREKVKAELDRMEKLKVISKVDEPTKWVNSMVVVPKPNGAVRICLDPRDLNKAINKEHYKMITLEEVTSQLSGAQYFTILDATSSYWAMAPVQRIIDFNYVANPVWSVSLFTNAFRDLRRSGGVSEEDGQNFRRTFWCAHYS